MKQSYILIIILVLIKLKSNLKWLKHFMFFLGIMILKYILPTLYYVYDDILLVNKYKIINYKIVTGVKN